MEQGSIYSIAVIGLGASGGFVSILLSKNPYMKVVGFDIQPPFSTLLPTGGGRCNISYDENDLREFVKNYPRGEKFLLSVFSIAGKTKIIELFNDLGIKTYVQSDKRIFPKTNSSKMTVEKLSSHLKSDNFIFKREKVIKISKDDGKYVLKTDKQIYKFDVVIVATGGHSNGYELAKQMGHKIIPLKPSLCALDIKEKNFYKLSGLTFNNVEITTKLQRKNIKLTGDILFAHKFITGPCIFKLSSVTAYEEITNENPLKFNLKLINLSKEEIEADIKNNSKKSIKKFFSKYVPESYITEILHLYKTEGTKQIAQMTKNEKELLINSLISLNLNATGRIKNSEIVTAGGVDLDEINSKTMESKLHKGLYFIGEVLNIDGYTGGFNLQNCWSGAFVCSKHLFN